MRVLRQLPLVLALALSLAPASAPAQAPPPAAPPAAPAAPAPPSAPVSEVPAKAPAAPAPPAAATRPIATEQPPQPSRRGRRGKAKKAEAPLTGAIATFPGFRMLPGGGSRVFLQVSEKVDIKESKAEGRLVYRMKGAQAITTNRFPLVTSFFATPVGKVQLVGQGSDLDMVIDLRQPSDATFRVMETERGIVVQVDFPALAAGDVAPVAATQGRTRNDMNRPAPKQKPAARTGAEEDGAMGY